MSSRTAGTRSRVDPGSLGKYQLDVTARDVVDVVRSAGGWLFDRAMAGWDVNVVLTGERPRASGSDLRPLHILGVSSGQREHDADSAAPARVLAIAASADAVADDRELRENVLRAMKRGIGDVLLWGSSWPHGVERGVEEVEHVLSAAARAFKGHALSAVGIPDAVGPIEAFRGRASFLTGYSDLTRSDLTRSSATSLAQR